MTVLTWDGIGDKIYESGIDRGVLYLSDGSGVAWNGLTAFEDKTRGESTPVYFDGIKYNDVYVHGDFEGTLKAFTYPDEFLEFEGIQDAGNGFFVSGQNPKTFGLSYRTGIGNDLDSELGYKIHLLHNLTAIPSTKAYKTEAKTIGLIEFQWDITAVPAKIPGFRPSPHLIFDTREVDPEFVEYLEGILYGTVSTPPTLPSFVELLNAADSWVPA